MNPTLAFRVAVAFAAGVCATACPAQTRLAGLFSDGAVLQRDQPIPVWGWAEPGDPVTVEFAGQSKTTVADSRGRWRVQLDPLPASADPRPLTARSRDSDTSADILVGEVWLGGGQYNMARPMVELAAGEADVRAANDPLLRCFRVPNRPGERDWPDVDAAWMRWERSQAPRIPSFDYYFARRLREELGVPVGMINVAWGSSGIATWISPEGIRAVAARGWWPEETMGARVTIQQSRLYHGMLAPLVPYAVKGILWYQGETDGEPYSNAYLYRHLFTELIQDWRRRWEKPDLPFYWVQLPGLRDRVNWPVLRESQASALRLPHTGMITTIDLGEGTQLYPENKQAFVDRMADLVLGRTYGKAPATNPPGLESWRVDNGRMRLTLSQADGGWATRDAASPRGFEIAGADRQFRPAQAAWEDGALVVWHPGIRQPAAVRHAWAPYPENNVINGRGLPLAPFRTDDWMVTGQEMEPQVLRAKSALADVTQAGALLAGPSSGWAFDAAVTDQEILKQDRALRSWKTERIFFAVPAEYPAGSGTGSTLAWTKSLEVDPARGLTVEVKALVNRLGHPLHGCDLEVGVRQPDGRLRRYRLSALPMRLHAFHQSEVWVLRTNLDNARAHSYRLAIRPDGVAQIYFDEQIAGTLPGEWAAAAAGATSYVKVGKTAVEGEWVASLQHVATDLSGAYAPTADALASNPNLL